MSVLQETSFCSSSDSLLLLLSESKRMPLPVSAGEELLHELQLTSEPDPSRLDPCQTPFLRVFVCEGKKCVPSSYVVIELKQL